MKVKAKQTFAWKYDKVHHYLDGETYDIPEAMYNQAKKYFEKIDEGDKPAKKSKKSEVDLILEDKDYEVNDGKQTIE